MRLIYLPSRIATSRRTVGLGVLALVIAFFQASPPVCATVAQEPGGAPGQVPGENERMPLFGKITAVHDKTLELSNLNGETVTVKITDKTEFRKDRQPAKRSDFKVGDVVVVRGEENADHSWTAQIVGARSTNGPNGPAGGFVVKGQNGTYGSAGTLGKDFVTGEIKSIDAPKLTVLRPDNVTQTFELNEDTSLRKGRESVTMADIQVGDHVFARGALQNDAFVPKMVVVIGPEQWKRMQEMGGQPGGPRRLTAPSPNADPQPQKSPEPQH
jgi:Domain of unknown function (DUF5666)